MSWKLVWTVVFFLSVASFVLVSGLICWRGLRDLRELFAKLSRDTS